MGWTPGSKMWANYTHLKPEEVRDAILEREGIEAAEISPEEATERVMAALTDIAKDPRMAARFRDILERVEARH